MPTAFVTGGSGFIGARLIRRLSGDGWAVRGLARSESSEEAVAAAGAEPVRGDIADVDSLRAGAGGCEVAFHAAAHLGGWGPREEFERANVGGTENTIAACRDAGVRRLVHVSTEAVLLAGEPLVNVDETAPLRPDSKSLYCSTKARAEKAVRDANGAELETVAVRPRFVWGPGDANILPSLTKMVRAGRFSWVGGGRHRTSTTHVDNAVEGLVLAAERGVPGGVYFVTDGEPVVFRDFVTDLLATQGIEPPDRNMPAGVARLAASACEGLWGTLPLRGAPPVKRMEVWVSSLDTTIDISRARRELGYEPVRTREEGLAELRSAAA